MYFYTYRISFFMKESSAMMNTFDWSDITSKFKP